MGFWNSIYEATGIACVMDMLHSDKKEEAQGENVGNVEEPKFHLQKHPEKKFNYRPEKLDDYISQDNAKSLIRLLFKEILEVGKMRHIIISGTRGHGKTTLAKIICNHLGFGWNYFISNSFTKENLKDFLIKNEKLGIPQVLMLDEVHGLDKELIEFFYPILEDMLLPNTDVKLKPFMVISATTEMDFLQKKFPPFIDRMVNIQLEPYKAEDIKLLLQTYNRQVYQKNISDEVFDILSRNGRYNPRTSILLFDLYIASGNVNEVLKCNRIIKNGITAQDINILKTLVEIKKPVGGETLAIVAHTDNETYKSLLEPYMVQEGLIVRTSRGRLATSKAELFLQELTKEGKI
jgi:Holliday junction DNA helicase RuvB